MYDEKETIKEIEDLRYRLTISANEKGFTHNETIVLSQALDCLLNKYNKENSKQLK